MSDTHEMRLVRTTPAGAEEWHCPTCDRRVLLQWPPRYELLVLVRGDESVTHAGGRDGLTSPTLPDPAAPYGVGPIQNIPRAPESGPDPDPTPASAEPAPEDRRWLREIGIDWDGDSAA